MQHVWELDGRGEIDDSSYDIETESGGCNGPRCTVCAFYFCMYCHPDWWTSECPGVRIDAGLWRPGDPVTDDVLEDS